jgi:hypothetical protein
MVSRIEPMHTTTTKEEEDRSRDSTGCSIFRDHFAAPLIGLIVFARRHLLTLGQKASGVLPSLALSTPRNKK